MSKLTIIDHNYVLDSRLLFINYSAFNHDTISTPIMNKISKLTLLVLTLLTMETAMARDVMIRTIPSGARLELTNLGSTRISGGQVYTSPAEIDFRSRSTPYDIKISLPGYETVVFTYDYRNASSRDYSIELNKIVDTQAFTFSSEPAGAEVLVDGRLVGVTPNISEIRFERRDSKSPWSRSQVAVRLANYETQTFSITRESPSRLPKVELPLIREVRTFELSTTSDGLALPEASIEINGKPFIKDGSPVKTPASLELEFTRKDGASAWNTYTIKTEIENEFEPSTLTVERSSPREITLDLAPVTEVPVTRYFPITEMSVRGPRLGVDMSAPLGMLDFRDQMGNYSENRRITDYKRNSPSLTAVNSFAITPDGQNVIYSLTQQREGEKLYANLFMKAANAQSLAVQQLTRGTQFFEVNPTMSSDPESTYVVFQSNRLGRRDSWDITAIRVQQGRILGGVVQVTHEPRFNYKPSLVYENRPLYFIGYENFASARPYISSVRLDGSSYTVLAQEALDVTYTEEGKVYYVQETQDPDVTQIFSLDAETNQISTVINSPGYTESNCFDPAISPDGSRMLFVSDYVRDEKDRPNNNIFLFNFDTGNVQLITDNGSDDIKPVWSPTEPNVIYYLSNREGAYNIWRLVLAQ